MQRVSLPFLCEYETERRRTFVFIYLDTPRSPRNWLFEQELPCRCQRSRVSVERADYGPAPSGGYPQASWQTAPRRSEVISTSSPNLPTVQQGVVHEGISWPQLAVQYDEVHFRIRWAAEILLKPLPSSNRDSDPAAKSRLLWSNDLLRLWPQESKQLSSLQQTRQGWREDNGSCMRLTQCVSLRKKKARPRPHIRFLTPPRSTLC